MPQVASKSAADVLNEQFMEMRWRALSLAADLDRIERAPGGKALVASDPRLAQAPRRRQNAAARMSPSGPRKCR